MSPYPQQQRRAIDFSASRALAIGCGRGDRRHETSGTPFAEKWHNFNASITNMGFPASRRRGSLATLIKSRLGNHIRLVEMSILKSLARHIGGATVIEYALIATLISILIFAGALSIGTNVSGIFGSVASSL
jgi:Flp pilus assembly pilin Flp